jgi:23S rRNA G2445 N2-methylase RlmL
VAFTGKLSDCYTANLWLRTPSRVLLRADEYTARANEELFRKTLARSWELWLSPELPLQVEAHVRRSRISHEGNTAATFTEAVRRRFRQAGLSPPPPAEDPATRAETSTQRVILHLTENSLSVSLDTTGAHLHRRGYRLEHAGAPLRENLAAAVLLWAGWPRACYAVVADPMCGSGTIPIEAALIAANAAPGRRREFCFQRWPSFQERTWAYLLRTAEAAPAVEPAVRVVGSDVDPAAVETARENARRAGVEDLVELSVEDVYAGAPGSVEAGRRLVVSNPPYGKRLGGGGTAAYERLAAAQRGWANTDAVLIVPKAAVPHRSDAGGKQELLCFRNGGIRVCAWLVRKG